MGKQSTLQQCLSKIGHKMFRVDRKKPKVCRVAETDILFILPKKTTVTTTKTMVELEKS